MRLVTLTLLALTSLTASEQADDSFRVIWNVPSHECANYNVTIDPAQYGFTVNSDDSFLGDRIALLYNPGLFPQILSNGTQVNGGIPQLGDLRLHLDAFSADLQRAIPDANFSGLAVIDFEEWTPWFGEAQKRYRYASYQAVRDEHPNWPDERIDEQAREDWEWWARLFLEQTLKAAEAARPAATWGYYQYPLCKNLEIENGTCPESVRDQNDQLSWLLGDSNALYPSIYLFLNGYTSENRRDTVIGRLVEAQRHAEGLPILPYTWFQYHDDESYLSDEDLSIMLGEPAARGSAGAIMWGASANCDSSAQCLRLEEYLRDHLGPIVQTLVGLTPAERDAWRQLLEAPSGRQLLQLSVKLRTHSRLDSERKQGVPIITEVDLLRGASGASFSNEGSYLFGEEQELAGSDRNWSLLNYRQQQKMREWQSSLDQTLWEIKKTRERALIPGQPGFSE